MARGGRVPRGDGVARREEPGGAQRLPFGLPAAIGLPLAALLAIAGQCLIAHRPYGLYRGLLPGAALYVAAAAALVLVLLRLRRDDPEGDAALRPAAPPAGGLQSLAPGLEWGLVALLIVAALYLRLHRIDTVPWGLNNDEAINALEVRDIRAGREFRSVTERGLNRETMFHHLAAGAYARPGLLLNVLRAMPAVFGLQPRILNDPSGLIDQILPLRSVSILIGTLTVLALYLFARARFGRLAAFVAALFLAVSPWHLLYSRVGLRACLAPLFAVVTVWLFLRGLERGGWIDHLAWGLACGLGFWTYTSYRAVPIAMTLFVLARPLWDAAAPRLRRLLTRPFLAGAGLAAAVLAGIALTSGLGFVGFLARGAYATLVTPRASYGLNLLHALSVANYFPPRYAVIQNEAFISDGVSTVFGLAAVEPETAVAAALATLGLLYAAWRGFAARRPDPAGALVVLCVAATVLTVGWAGPSLTRLLIDVPWIALCAGLFGARLYAALAAIRRPLTAWAGGAVLAALVGWGVVAGYQRYFLRAGGSEEAMQHFGSTQTIMGMFVRSLEPGPLVYVLHTLRVDALRYFIGDRPDVYLVSDPGHLDLDTIIKLPRTATFVVENARPFAEVLRYLIARYPTGDMTQVADARLGPDRIIFYTFTLWKDASGQPVMPPAEPAPGPGPAGMPSGIEPLVPPDPPSPAPPGGAR